MSTTTTPQSAAQPKSLSVFGRYAIITIDDRNSHAERVGACKVLLGELDRVCRKIEKLAEEHKMRAEDVRPHQFLEIRELLEEWTDAVNAVERYLPLFYSPVVVLQELSDDKRCSGKNKMSALNVLLKYRAVVELVEEITK